jgi:hypothetical protein
MGKFIPKDHIRNMERDKTKPPRDYMDVKWRLVWFREEHPNGRIDADVQVIGEMAIVKAQVWNNDGVLIASGMATVRSDARATWSGRDFEKAETAAVGRALAVAGYGSQFTDDMDEGDYLADSPVERNQPSNVTQMPSQPMQSGYTEPTNLIATKMSNGKTPKPFMVIEGVTVWSREPFRVLKFADTTIDSLANVGMTKLETPIIVAWELDDKGYKVPVSIKRTDSPIVVDSNGKVLDFAS